MNNEEYLNKNSEGYKAFGSYDYYKKEILERMFLCQKWIAQYEREFFSKNWWTDGKDEHRQHNDETYSVPELSDKPIHLATFTNDIPAMVSYITYLRRQIETLYPKISKLEKDEQKKYYDIFDGLLDDDRKTSWMKYTRNYKAYRMYIQLIEELGYSDMNMKQDVELGGDY